VLDVVVFTDGESLNGNVLVRVSDQDRVIKVDIDGVRCVLNEPDAESVAPSVRDSDIVVVRD